MRGWAGLGGRGGRGRGTQQAGEGQASYGEAAAAPWRRVAGVVHGITFLIAGLGAVLAISPPPAVRAVGATPAITTAVCRELLDLA
jgi:hypothetical protein